MPVLTAEQSTSPPLARGLLYDARTISLHLTDLCNQACVFCAADTSAGTTESVSTESLLGVLDAHPPRQWPTVNIHGGEPTIRRDFLDLLTAIRERGYQRVLLQTNALRMSQRSFAEQVHRIGVDVFVCGFHAADVDTSRVITRNPHAFELALRGFARIKDAGAALRVTTVACLENYRQLPDIARLCVDHGVDHLNLSAMQPEGFAWAHLVSYATCQPYLLEAIGTALDAGLTVTLEGFPYCVCPGYEALQVDWSSQNLRVTFHDLRIADYNTFLNATTRIRVPACTGCVVADECGGVYRDYVSVHGDDAFEPYHVAGTSC